MKTHEPEPIDIKTTLHFSPVRSEQVFRIPCSCGWRGSWFGSLDYAESSYQRHAVKVGPLPVSA